MNYTKIDNINYRQLSDFYYRIENKIVWNSDLGKNRQTSIQYADRDDVFLSSTDNSSPDRLDQEYHLLNPLFVNTPFEDIVGQYKLVRSKLMWIDSRSCYSIHEELSKSVCIPLVSNPDCRFLFLDDLDIFHLPLGGAYTVNTDKKHTFCNFSDTPGLHIVGKISS